jgi:hypothetical protein
MKLVGSLLLCFTCGAAFAQSPPQGAGTMESSEESVGAAPTKATATDSLVFQGDWYHDSSAPGGGGGSVDWIHSTEDRSTFTAGVASYSLAGSQWTLGRGSAAFHLVKRIVIHSQASIGGGQSAGSSFAYQWYQGDLTYRAANWLFPKIEENYFRVGSTRGNLLKCGTFLVPFHTSSVEIEYARSVTGNLNTSFAMLRFEQRLRLVRFYGGFAAGQTAPQIFNISVGIPAPAPQLREGFLGLLFPISRYEIGSGLDFLDLSGAVRTTLAFTFKLPLGKPTAEQRP